MADNDPKNSDPQGQSAQATGKEDPQNGGESNKDDQLPEKFKGKTAQEIAKSYIELEKKTGENSQTFQIIKQQLDKSETQLKGYESLGKFLQANPALLNLLESEIKKQGQQPLNRSQDNPNDSLVKDLTDTKLATQNQIIRDFENKFGISNLPTDESDTLKKRVGKELHALIDIKGTKTFDQVLAGIPLDVLPLYLEKAYRLATDNDEKEKARLKGMLETRRNNQGSFGNMPSSNIPTNTRELSPEQKKVAQRLGIGEDKYLKNLQEIEK